MAGRRFFKRFPMQARARASMRPGIPQQILNASSNLLGICFVLVTGMKLTGVSDKTFADEICLFSAFCFLCACVFSYVSMRTEREDGLFERTADYLFLGGLVSLFIAVAVFAEGVI